MAINIYIFIFAIFIPRYISEFLIKDTAVLYDTDSFHSTHSVIIDLLKSYSPNGIEFGKLDSHFSLLKFDRIIYKNLFIFSTSKKWVSSLKDILEFADKGGNIFAVGNLQNNIDFSNFVSEVGFLTEGSGILVDHANSREINQDSIKTVAINKESINKGFLKQGSSFDPILYRGFGFGIDYSNPMTFSIISGSSTSFLQKTSKSKKVPNRSGTDVVLVGGVEMRNLGRIVVMGSIDALSDKYFLYHVPSGIDILRNVQPLSSSANLKFFISLVEWCFQRSGVLRVVDANHKLISSGLSLNQYIVETLLEYSVKIEEQTITGEWVPFVVNDIQLEIVRLTTFGRVNYNVSQDGIYTAQFYAPDFIGTYGLQTKYKKPRYTTLNHETKIIIRPRRHNDYDRFIFGAYPFYLTAFLMMGMTYILIFVLLNQKQVKTKTE